jgi:hypothetical protein
MTQHLLFDNRILILFLTLSLFGLNLEVFFSYLGISFKLFCGS